MWSYDFVFDQTADGRPLKVLPVVDVYTRECLAMVVGRSLTAADVVETLAGIVGKRGVPVYPRSDNGPEFIAAAVKGVAGGGGRGDVIHRAGQPVGERVQRVVQQPASERTAEPGGVRQPGGAKVILADYRRAYNHDRPHSSLGYVAPAVFASRLLPADLAPLGPPTATA